MTPTRLNGEQVEQRRRSAFFLLDTMLPFRETDAA
jgi:hypothetical protein